MKHLFRNALILFTSSALLFATACNKDDDDPPPPEHEEEVITTLEVTFTPQGGGADIVYSFTDLDGDGPGAPTLSEPALDASTTYDVSITLLNENEPVDMADPHYNVTLEIQAEDEEHQLFFDIGAGLNLTFDSYDDTDGNGDPIGIESTFTTGAASTGDFTVTLRHEPNKSAAGVAAGDITNAGGETDIEVTFNMTIN